MQLNLDTGKGVIYKINCSDCDQCYIGETKRWFKTRKKEHMRDVKNSDNNATVLVVVVVVVVLLFDIVHERT